MGGVYQVSAGCIIQPHAGSVTEYTTNETPFLSYSALKKKIYDLGQQKDNGTLPTVSPESQGLLNGHGPSMNDVFLPLLDSELDKITAFYTHQEKDVMDELEEVRNLVEEKEELGLNAAPYRDDDDDDDDDDDEEDDEMRRSTTRDSSKRRRKGSLGAQNGVFLVGSPLNPFFAPP